MKGPELDIIPGLSRGLYVYDKAHALLAKDCWKDAGPNIGSSGENLTISFLSMNRSSLSIKLLESIERFLPNFAGEILIIDNGSSEEEIECLRIACKALSFRTRIVELGQNFGVSGGRNRTIPHVTTEWLMCLDNDIYFTFNPLKEIQNDLAVLGCHFMSLPLLDPDGETIFARGGHVYVSYEEGELHIGAGSASLQTKVESTVGQPFLGTFLFGGACVIKKETFTRLGGYDEGMFVGFEDIDFSVRLFQEGYKVGCASSCALVHDHPMPDSDADRDYEKERFSRGVLHKSAMHLEEKHGFKIWGDAVDRWVEARHQELGLNKEEGHISAIVHAHTEHHQKTKIALIIDTDNWAFGNIARQLERYLSYKFDFVVIPMDIIDNINKVFLLTEDCDIVHFFWREHLTLIGTPYYKGYAESLGIPYELFHERFIASKILSTSVYDHLLLEKNELSERAYLFNNVIDGYTVGSEKLNRIYCSVENYPFPTEVVEDGVNLHKFHPINIERLQHVSQRELVVGWVGNSKWAAELEDFKGVNTILKPAIEQLQQEGVPIRALFADRQERFIPHDKMPDYYAQIDVYVCTSKIEGTPNPVLEAMACGVPVISTDVGIVPQAFGDLQKGFILPERSVEALKASLRKLAENPTQLLQLSSENVERIKDWDWSIKAEKFGRYFDGLIATNQHGNADMLSQEKCSG
ncbi:glycosyltransferase [Pseudomonas sp. GW456-12-1-14-TSB6]|uniref:glycosyltransferase n=1 Tax=Pseudomonas sp. GW456-12-1-14-TSB6 TaxID=2751350 RepID=UPI000CD07D2E|nr:glycosyltransferase [Pseudomonas sp. GW456-12-1-14-TSB6]POA36571.1 glycosyl transferase family 1 [Pseudomonas sp. GW456-12-1-14-TSB6]